MDLIAKGDYDNGYQLLRSVSSNYDVDSIIIASDYSRSLTYIENGEYAEALALLSNNPDYEESEDKISQCHYELGKAELEGGNLQGAVDHLVLANNYSGADTLLADAYDRQADALYQNQDYEAALELYQLADNDSQVSECYFKMAEASSAQGDYFEAAGYYSNATTHSDHDALSQEAYHNYLLEAVEIEGRPTSYYSGLLTTIRLLDPEVYSDVDELTKAIKYNQAKAYVTAGSIDQAVALFNAVSGFRDSAELANSAMYGYVTSHRDRTDSVTYRYLVDLKSAYYRDSESIYNTLYAWHATVIPVASDSSTSRVSSFSRYDNWYFYIKLTGGVPGGTTEIRATLTFPDGDNVTTTWDGSWGDGYTGYCWFYYDNPFYGDSGPITLRVYDKWGNPIGEASSVVY